MTMHFVAIGLTLFLAACVPTSTYYKPLQSTNTAVLEMRLGNSVFIEKSKVYLNQPLDGNQVASGIAFENWRQHFLSAEEEFAWIKATPPYNEKTTSIAAGKKIEIIYTGIPHIKRPKGCFLSMQFTPEANAHYVFGSEIITEHMQDPGLIDKVLGFEYDIRCHIFLKQKKGASLVDVPFEMIREIQDTEIRE